MGFCPNVSELVYRSLFGHFGTSRLPVNMGHWIPNYMGYWNLGGFPVQCKVYEIVLLNPLLYTDIYVVNQP